MEKCPDAVVFDRRNVRAGSVNRDMNAFERLSRDAVDRGPFKMRILRANVRAKDEEEYEALHVIRV